MDQSGRYERAGCGQAIVIASTLLWLGAVPIGITVLAQRALNGATALVVILSAVLWLVPLLVMARLTRRHPGWRATYVFATGATIVAGYLVLDAGVRGVFPMISAPSLHGEGWGVAILRLGILTLYALLAAWLASRLSIADGRPLREWLGLSGFNPQAFLLALTVAALVTLSWPVTGALGDSLTSLSLFFQALAEVIPEALVFWGVVFTLLNVAFARPWMGALTTILLYGVTTLGGVLPEGNWGVLADAIVLLPLAFLLAELRARDGRFASILLLALCYKGAPLLFVDPRDALAEGIPELQHILSHIVVLASALVLALVLWGGRRAMPGLARRARFLAWGGALMAWAVWVTLYVVVGEPGFANDGFLIVLEEQADLSAACSIPDREARLQCVYETLVETAQRTQAPLWDELDIRGVPYRPYYVINMVRVDGHRTLMRRIEDWPGVAQVLLNPNVRKYPWRIPLPYGVGESQVGEVQPNLAVIHADEAWALGVTGEGIVVGGQDTGYDWTHPALQPHYRGWDGHQANHDANWHDAWDDTVVPFDDDSHGTHTMGTMVGDDGAGERTGVAPGATWIGCRNMRRGLGNPGAYAECTEFFLAPYPHGGDPFTDGDVRLAPHVVNNSWACPDFEGCFADTLEPAIEALRAAGIMVVVSAGNEGPACRTVSIPPAGYDAVFSVGATDDGGTIAGFSSRGPAGEQIKPDIVAPGANVRSSVPGGGYGYAGGTSMAGPHVAGLVALLWSADPALIGEIEDTERLICQTAAPRPVANLCTVEEGGTGGPFAALLENPVCACGGVTGTPNNVYGCGLIDVGAALQAVVK